MSTPIKVAACPLLFRANGGQFTENGLPIIGGRIVHLQDEQIELDENDNPLYPEERQLFAPFLCDKAFDCGTCPLLHQWVAGEQASGWVVGWECWICLKDSWAYERGDPKVERNIAGFYQAGRPPDLIPDDEDYDPDNPPLRGCTSCGKGRSILQLVLRRAR